jgi:hypothetical protein
LQDRDATFFLSPFITVVHPAIARSGLTICPSGFMPYIHSCEGSVAKAQAMKPNEAKHQKNR